MRQPTSCRIGPLSLAIVKKIVEEHQGNRLNVHCRIAASMQASSHAAERRFCGRLILPGARLTIALQVQEATLRSFFDRSGGLARGTGFLARFLLD